MKCRLAQLKVHATPKAEKMFAFCGLPEVEFDFPGTVGTVLFISCGLVRSDVRFPGMAPYLDVVGRLYASDNPQESSENHIGKLYVWAHDHSAATRFETKCERLEWHPDGSFDVIEPDGRRTRITPPAAR